MAREVDVQAILKLASRGWVTLPQVARLAGVSYPTILKIRRRGQLRAVKVGGMYRVYEDELVRFLVQGNYVNERTVQALSEEEMR